MKITWVWTNKEGDLESIKRCVGSGWSKLLEELVLDLEKLGWDGQLLQVKNKFDELRFYINDGSKETHARIAKAEEESRNTCMNCGKLSGDKRGKCNKCYG